MKTNEPRPHVAQELLKLFRDPLVATLIKGVGDRELRDHFAAAFKRLRVLCEGGAK
jgi:hypothetical protein